MFGGFFSYHLFHRERKKVCSEPLQGELTQLISFSQTSTIPHTNQSQALPSSQAPSLYTTPPSPKAADSLHHGSHNLCPACDFRLQERSQAPGRNWLHFHY